MWPDTYDKKKIYYHEFCSSYNECRNHINGIFYSFFFISICFDFSGVPGETGYKGHSAFAGLGFNVVIEGHGVDGKGAIYKGKNDDSWYPKAATFSSRTQRIILPNVELTSSASVKVVAGETLLMNNASEQEGGAYAQGRATHMGNTLVQLHRLHFCA